MCHSLRRLGVRRNDLEDVAYDVFVAVVRHMEAYDPARPLRPWLFGFAFRVALDYRRLACHRHEVIGVEVEPIDDAPGADARIETEEARRLVAEVLGAIELDRRAVFVLGRLTGAALHAALQPPVRPETIARHASLPAPVRPSPEPPPVTPSAAARIEVPDAAPAVRPVPAPPLAAAPPTVPVARGGGESGRDVDMAAERALLEVARTALARGQVDAALDRVQRHARRFPRGQLAEERESVWIQALVAADRAVEARQRAAEFRRRFPQSMLRPVAEAAVRSIP